MSDESNSTRPDEPAAKKNIIPKIVWLFIAFSPCAVAIICMKIVGNPSQWMLTSLFILNGVCSFASAGKLLDGMKSRQAQIAYRFTLGLFFFIMNIFIALFVGCSAD